MPNRRRSDHPLSEVLPELDEMMKTAREGTQRLVQGQITITRDGHERNLSVRITAEQTSQSRDSYIITLDDITELVSAQRTSAWGDVARRIAHEIKNPLTPIQLSAERIRRKFGKVITEDKGIFEQCTDTIVRQVDDIRRMVDEFSRFARMPKPVMEGEDVADTVRQAVFLMKVGHPELDIEAEIKQEPMRAQFDRRLISQALTNIIKNATEAIEQVPPEELGKGRIDVIAAARERRHRDRRDRQRYRPAEGRACPTARALCDDAREGHRAWPRDRRPRARRPWRPNRTQGCCRFPAGAARRLDAVAVCRLRSCPESRSQGACGRSQAEATEPTAETKAPAPETIEPAATTNNETKIQAATGD